MRSQEIPFPGGAVGRRRHSVHQHLINNSLTVGLTMSLGFQHHRDDRRGLVWPPLRCLCILGPLEWQVHDPAGRRRCLENAQGCPEHLPLCLGVANVTVRPAEWMCNRCDPRCADGRLISRHHAEDHRRNPSLLDHARNQSHGPAAVRSNRGEHSARHPLRLHQLGDRRRGLHQLRSGIRLEAHH